MGVSTEITIVGQCICTCGLAYWKYPSCLTMILAVLQQSSNFLKYCQCSFVLKPFTFFDSKMADLQSRHVRAQHARTNHSNPLSEILIVVQPGFSEQSVWQGCKRLRISNACISVCCSQPVVTDLITSDENFVQLIEQVNMRKADFFHL